MKKRRSVSRKLLFEKGIGDAEKAFPPVTVLPPPWVVRKVLRSEERKEPKAPSV